MNIRRRQQPRYICPSPQKANPVDDAEFGRQMFQLTEVAAFVVTFRAADLPANPGLVIA
jgi:hypothetical protein